MALYIMYKYWRPNQESNLEQKLRRFLLYPLTIGPKACHIIIVLGMHKNLVFAINKIIIHCSKHNLDTSLIDGILMQLMISSTILSRQVPYVAIFNLCFTQNKKAAFSPLFTNSKIMIVE